MKKTFSYTDPKHKPARVVEAIKSDVRKYMKRERRKELPEEVDFWDFDCRVGRDASSAEASHSEGLISAIDRGANESWPSIYIEILAKPGHRSRKPARQKEDEEAAEKAR
ncbi:MAG: hypothetical protein ISQ14_07745 [Verrucomicrobiae bacterium]|jgi:hypothetical protein|nr:hypothetical protein [Verrucomicrobiae bacterium]